MTGQDALKEVKDESYLTLFSRHKFSFSFIFLSSLLSSSHFVFSSLSVSVFLLCLSVSPSPCDVASCVVCDVVCGSAHVVCGVHAGKPSVSTQHVPVCTFKTSPCVPAPREHVFQHVRVVLVRAFCTCTRGRRGSSSVLLTKICPHMVITCFRSSPKKLLDLTYFKFENRSRTTCSRFLQQFALPDKAVQLHLSCGTLQRNRY